MRAPDELKNFVARKFEWEYDEFTVEGREYKRRILARDATVRDIVQVLREAQWDLLSVVRFAKGMPRWLPGRLEFIEEVIGSEESSWAT